VSDSDDNQPILTEEEIEALVDHAVSSDRFDDGEFRSHDFGAGEALTLSKWTELDGLLRTHAEALEVIFANSFGVEASVEPFAPLFAKVKDLIAAMPERLCLISTEISPLAGESHLELPGNMLAYLVNQYFGGGAVAAPKLFGKLTPSEQRLGEHLAKDILRTMSEIWADRLSVTPGDLYVDITPDRLTLTPGDIGYVVLTFMVSVEQDFRGEFRIMLPFEGLEAHERQLKPRLREKPSVTAEPEWEAKLQKAVPDIAVEVRGVLSHLETNIKSLLAMKVGMVIPLEQPNQVHLAIDTKAIAVGQYGAHEGKRAVQITQFEGHLS